MPKYGGKRRGVLDTIEYAQRRLRGEVYWGGANPIIPGDFCAQTISRLLNKLTRKYRKRRHERSTSRLPTNQNRK